MLSERNYFHKIYAEKNCDTWDCDENNPHVRYDKFSSTSVHKGNKSNLLLFKSFKKKKSRLTKWNVPIY